MFRETSNELRNKKMKKERQQKKNFAHMDQPHTDTCSLLPSRLSNKSTATQTQTHKERYAN